MKVPPRWRNHGYHSRVRALFLKTYKKEPWFQMTQHGVGTDMWHVEGRIGLQTECKLKNARARFKRVLMECYEDFVPKSAETNAFSDYLSSPNVLSVQPDVEPFSCDGPMHSWTVIEPASQLPPQRPAAATAGASGAHGGGTAPPTSVSGSADATAASSTPQPPPPQARHQPPWALLHPAAHQCGPCGRCNRCPGAGALTDCCPAPRRRAGGRGSCGRRRRDARASSLLDRSGYGPCQPPQRVSRRPRDK